MGITLRRLLDRYFNKGDIKYALEDIGEVTSGSKSQLIGRISRNWQEHNRKFYDLLDYVNKDIIKELCMDYGIDSYGSRDTLVRRIKKSDLLDLGKASTTVTKGTKKSLLLGPSTSSKTVIQTTSTTSSTTPPGPQTEVVPAIRRVRFFWRAIVSLIATLAIFLVLPSLGFASFQILATAIMFFITLVLYLQKKR